MADVAELEQAPADAGIVDPKDAAEEAGLHYVRDDTPGITRRKWGISWGYNWPDGRKVADRPTLDRVRKLAIPPAYTDVWICPDPAGHIQATGRDAKGRKQYRYHDKFREVREGNKFAHMLDFVHALPGIRARVAADMAKRGMPRPKVLATVVYLLEHTLIRVGNDEYAKTNKSFGLTTLRDRHVKVEGDRLRFKFKGKSGKEWNLDYRDRRIARIVKASQDLPGQHLFQYVDDDGHRREVTSGDVNAYLHEIAGPAVTAKDFRTWTGTVLAAHALAAVEAADTAAAQKKAVRRAIEQVAGRLGNTPAVCRKAYVHPEVVSAYLNRELRLEIIEEIDDELAGALPPEERVVLRFLKRRLQAAPAA